MCTTRSASPPAPATEPTRGGPALLLCAHGTRGLAGAAGDHAAALVREGGFAEVRACALYAEPRLERVLDAFEAPEAVLVPYMMAEGYTLEVMRRRLGAHPRGGRVRLARPVGVCERLTPLIAGMALATCRAHGWPAGQTALLLVGHGTTRNPASADTARAHAARLRAAGTFAEVATAFLDQSPSVAEAVAGLAAGTCVAVGFFADSGDHGGDDVPPLLAATGRRCAYAGPVGPQAAMLAVIRAQAAGAAPAHGRETTTGESA